MQVSFNISELLAVSKATAALKTGSGPTLVRALAVQAALVRAEQVLCTPGVVYSDAVRSSVYCRLIGAIDFFEDVTR